MFLGHYGLAFAAKRVAPKTSLGTLTLAGNLADCVWPILLLLGVERMRVVPGYTAYTPFAFDYYPWSHSLAIEVLAGLVLGGVVFALQKEVRGAVVAGLLVPSHWFLDIPFHRPDLPLYPGGPKLGFGLWNSVALSVLAEILVFGGGVYLYLRTTRAKDTVGTAAFWVLVFLLFALAASSALERPPDNPTAVAFSALGLWVLVPWAYWIDRHRSLRAHAASRG